MTWYEDVLIAGFAIQMAGLTSALLVRIQAMQNTKGGRARLPHVKWAHAAGVTYFIGSNLISIAVIYVILDILERAGGKG